MKQSTLLLAGLAALLSLSFTGTNICNESDFFVQGTYSKMGHYEADGKQTGTSTSKVTKVYTSGDSTIAEIESDYVDAKKGESHKGAMRYICIGDAVILDMQGMISAALQQSEAGDMTVVIEGNMVKYKNTYTVGEKLEDIDLVAKTYKETNLMSTMHMRMHDRKVEAKETRTTPAGTFECYKITAISEVSMKIGSMSIPGMKPFRTVDFFSPKAGNVRTESYKTDDKLSTFTELLELKKP